MQHVAAARRVAQRTFAQGACAYSGIRTCASSTATTPSLERAPLLNRHGNLRARLDGNESGPKQEHVDGRDANATRRPQVHSSRYDGVAILRRGHGPVQQPGGRKETSTAAGKRDAFERYPTRSKFNGAFGPSHRGSNDEVSVTLPKPGDVRPKVPFGKFAGTPYSEVRSIYPDAATNESRRPERVDRRALQNGVARNADQVNSSTSKSSMILRGRHSIMHHLYEPFPSPLNITSFPQTKVFAVDRFHPKHIKIQRQIQSFDPKSFIWVVRCPVSVCKKPAYRHAIEKKVRRAFVKELEKKGYNADGSVAERPDIEIDSNERNEARRRGRISGALVLALGKDAMKTLRASGEDIRNDVRSVLSEVLEQQETAMGTSTRASPMPPRRNATPRTARERDHHTRSRSED